MSEPDDLQIGMDRLETLLGRLGFNAMPQTDIEGLSRLYGSWLRAIPFCSTLKRCHYGPDPDRAGPLPVMTAPEFIDAFLADGTGGTCFPAAEALYQTLRACGFETRRAIGTMLDFPDIPGPNHGTVLVEIDGRSHLVDPFFGNMVPLPLDGSVPEAGPPHVCLQLAPPIDAQDQPVVLWRFHTARERFRFGFDTRYTAVNHALFAERYERSTGPNSVFNRQLYISRHTETAVKTIFRGAFYVLDQDGTIEKRPIETRERDQILVDDFGLSERIVHRIPADLEDE